MKNGIYGKIDDMGHSSLASSTIVPIAIDFFGEELGRGVISYPCFLILGSWLLALKSRFSFTKTHIKKKDLPEGGHFYLSISQVEKINSSWSLTTF